MNTKFLFSLFIVLVIAATAGAVLFFRGKPLAPSVLAPSQPVAITIQDKQITDNTKPFVIRINYPYIAGLDEFNNKVQDIITKETDSFKTNSLENDAAVKETDPTDYAKYPREYDLNIGYDKGQIDGDVVSVIFNIYNFEGGAHGASYFIPLSYDIKNKTEIKLADLFPGQSDYLQKISAFCIIDLTKQITKALGNTEGTWLADGAGPKPENFQFFLINPDNTITFYFPQYQVAFYAAGDFKVIYPR